MAPVSLGRNIMRRGFPYKIWAPIKNVRRRQWPQQISRGSACGAMSITFWCALHKERSGMRYA